jgi:hypothetical protein
MAKSGSSWQHNDIANDWELASNSPHHPREFLKQVMAIHWPRAGFGVILYAERWAVGQLKPAITAVEQAGVRGFCVCWQSARIDREAVVHAGNFDCTVGQSLYGMVRAAVALVHLCRLCTHGKTKHWWPRQMPNNGLPVANHCWITGTA